MYKLSKQNNDGVVASVLHTEKKCWIPFDPANTDYQEYLKWLSEGNEPLPADTLEE